MRTDATLVEQRPVYLWGAGSSAIEFLDAYPEIEFDAFIETAQRKAEFRGHPVLAACDVNFSDASIIICSEFVNEIREMAILLGAQNHRIVPYHEVMIRDADACFVSYQKCGRTWLRLMLGRIFQQRSSLPEREVLRITQSGMRFKASHPKMPTMVFFHDDEAHRKTADEMNVDKSFYKSRRIVFLVRDPRDVIVSNYYHMTFRAKQNDLSMKDFARRFYPGIIRFYNIWADVPVSDFLIVRYEDLKRDTKGILREIITFLEVRFPISDEIIEEAVAYCSISNMAQYEKDNKFNSTILCNEGDKRSAKVRLGKISGFDSELDGKTICWCNQLLEGVNPIFGYGRSSKNGKD